MICPSCQHVTGRISEQHWNDQRTATVMTEQDACTCGWKGEKRELTAAERAEIDRAVEAGAATAKLGKRGLHLRDLPLNVRRQVQQAMGAQR